MLHPAMDIECIIFDFFGVICSEIAPSWLPRHLSSPQALLVMRDLVGAADRGSITEAEMFSNVGTLCGVDAATVESDWYALAVIDLQVVALLNRLARRYRLALLTNATAPFVHTVLSRSGLEPIFEAIIVSSDVGLAKPDPAIYEGVLAQMALSASRTLFIDDNPANVEGARGVGMQAIDYKSYDGLEEQLRTYGVRFA